MNTEYDTSQLEPFGYNQYTEAARKKIGAAPSALARISAEHRGVYEIVQPRGSCRAAISGKLMADATRREDYPAVGDWVVVGDAEQGVVVIEEILERQTVLRKKYNGKDESQLIAANVDAACIVAAMDRDYNINRFERYIVLVREAGVRPVIILNKSDLLTTAELNQRIEEIKARFDDVQVLLSSTVTAHGMDELEQFLLPRITYCFLGSSGVGKSSIINILLHQNSIETKEIGQKTGRGVHTTTARHMYFTHAGAIIIDNPGSREVGMVDVERGAKETFSDIEVIAQSCKFRDCGHVDVLDCAVLSAVHAGEIDGKRYENYLRLKKEAAYFSMTKHDKRQKDRAFGKTVKQAKLDAKQKRRL